MAEGAQRLRVFRQAAPGPQQDVRLKGGMEPVVPGPPPVGRLGQELEANQNVEPEARILGRIFGHGRHRERLEGVFALDLQAPADGILGSEQPGGRPLRQDDAPEVRQGRLGIAVFQGEGKDVEHARVGVGDAHARHRAVRPDEILGPGVLEPDELLDVGQVLLEGGTERHGQIGIAFPAVPLRGRGPPVGPEDPVGVGVLPVEAELVDRVQHEQREAGDADGQPEDVDGGQGLVPGHAAHGHFDIARDHGRLPGPRHCNRHAK